MAVADQEVTNCHDDQRSKNRAGVAGVGATEPGAEHLQTSKEEKEMGDMTVGTGHEASVPSTGGEKVAEVVVHEEESELYKEWKERERKYREYLEEVTSNPGPEQERLLEHILKKNANTVYLRQFELKGATDVATFRERVPVGDYETIRPLIERIIDGDKTPLLSVDPVVEVLASSGTSGGESKLFPVTDEDKSMRALIWNLMRPVLNGQFPLLEKGKCTFFYFTLPGYNTAGGVLRQAAVTSFIMSKDFKQRPYDPSYRLTSPDEVIESGTWEESTHCHLICALLQREEVLRFGAIFSSALVRAIRYLEESWPEICEDLAHGTLSETKVQSQNVRAAVQPYLRADPELAEFVRQECSKKSWKGIIRKLWPNCMIIDTVCTGVMESYTPIVCHYSDNLPLICTQLYAASEGYFGINLNPMCRPEDIYYTLLPTVAYFEFIPVSVDEQEDSGEILDLVSVKEGHEYEILVTTVAGLYRHRVGDILKVVGFYNASPTFQFIQRANAVLCVDTDKTEEKDLQLGVTKAAKLLHENMGLTLQDYTSTVNKLSAPPSYVIYIELRKDEGITENIPTNLLEQCCAAVELSFPVIYRRNRANKQISPLELRIVKEGTFERIAEFAFSRGTSPAQYKTPRGLGSKQSAQLEILNDGLIQQYICQSCPPLPKAYSKPTEK